MNKALITIAASTLLLTGCASMTDGMDSFSGMGNIEVEENSFDESTIVSLSPDVLYNPDASIFDPVNTKLGAVWSTKSPKIIGIVLFDDSNSSSGNAYTNFDSISVKVNGQIKEYQAGRTKLDNSGYNQVASTIFTSSRAVATMPVTDFQEMLSADSCQLKIVRDEGYELADCTADRIPGGKKTAILGFRKMLSEIESR